MQLEQWLEWGAGAGAGGSRGGREPARARAGKYNIENAVVRYEYSYSNVSVLYSYSYLYSESCLMLVGYSAPHRLLLKLARHVMGHCSGMFRHTCVFITDRFLSVRA